MSGIIIVIDIGNSGAKLGAVRGDKVAGPVRLPKADGRTVRDMAKPMLAGQEAVFAIAGSDPRRIQNLAWDLGKLRIGTIVEVGPEHAGIPVPDVVSVERAGVDRRLQLLAAAHLAGEAAAVVSCGTAITVDVGNSEGALLGGAILPGLGLGARALSQGTARLPEIELAGEVAMPARDTIEAIRVGLRVGGAGAVERLLVEAGVEEATPVYLTGQDAAHLAPHLARPVRAHGGLGILGAALAVRKA